MIGARGSLDDDGRGIARGKGDREQRTAEPPAEDEQRPFGKIFVFGNPEPDPGEIGKSVAHRHPEQYPEQAVTVENFSGVAEQVKNSVIDKHVDDAERQPDNYGHVFFPPEKQGGEQQQERGVQPDIKGIELPARDHFGHGNFLLNGFLHYTVF